jgi:RNA polymerase sigma factor (sigma-70 family)
MERPKETYLLIKEKNKDAIACLYERYGKKLYAYATSNWKMNEDEVWDIVYKTLYKIVEATATHTFESEQKFSSFTFTTFINYLRNYYRDKKTKQEPELVELKDSHIKKVQADEPVNDKVKLLNRELSKLQDWERILLLMRGQDIAYSEIAKYVDKPQEQLKVYYQRLKKLLAERMNEVMNQQNKNTNGNA